VNDFGNKVKRGAKRSTKDEARVITAQVLLINDAAMDEEDKELLRILQTFLLDLVENSYNPICEELYEQMLP
jgi:uncharacterized protein YfaP (DUF2135 family)